MLHCRVYKGDSTRFCRSWFANLDRASWNAGFSDEIIAIFECFQEIAMFSLSPDVLERDIFYTARVFDGLGPEAELLWRGVPLNPARASRVFSNRFLQPPPVVMLMELTDFVKDSGERSVTVFSNKDFE